MIKNLLIPVFISLLIFTSYAQELPENDSNYKIDTLIKESTEFPGVYDTVIVYKKINIVHKELVVVDTNFTPVIASWEVGLQGTYATSISSTTLENLASSQNIAGIDANISGYHKNFGFSFLLGVEQKRGKHSYTQRTMEQNTRNETVTDTVDIYYINHTNGSQTPVYVTKEREIEHIDTSYNVVTNTNSHHISYANIGINLTYGVSINKWDFLGLINYKLGVVLNTKGALFDKNGDAKEISSNSLSSLQHRGGLGMRVAYHFHPKTALYLNGTYQVDLSSVYTGQDVKYNFIGLNLGVLVDI